jgi:gamma-glutamyltranspeptidase / glutathione hydrolase / leukotriene-C4 hydrolase
MVSLAAQEKPHVLPLPAQLSLPAHSPTDRKSSTGTCWRIARLVLALGLVLYLFPTFWQHVSSVRRLYTCHHVLNHEPERNPALLIEARHGAVASENLRCSKIGVQVLKDGGNAVDAAIATTLCIGVVNMFSCVVLTLALY